MRFSGLVFCFLFIFQLAISQQNLKKGQIIDSIAVSNTQNETFALYLPQSYDETKLSPILFVFEPAARGSLGVEVFREASEKYGHIIICSNNAKNGSYERNFAIADNLFKHIFSNFNIDADKMFLAGFSGGSRLAAAIATLTNSFKGVIACGAGFSGNASHVPISPNFTYVGLCGDEDFNYREMIRNKAYLDRFKFKNTLITFESGHRWPDSKQIERAFRWLTVQENTFPNSEDFIKKSYLLDLEQAKTFENSGRVLKALENYQRIISLYGGKIGLDSVKAKYNELFNLKASKQLLKSRDLAFEAESKAIEKYIARVDADLKKPERANLDWWQKEMNKLDKISHGKDEQFGKMVFRVKYTIFAMLFERQNRNPNDWSAAKDELSKKIRNIIYPKS
ncbi:hypothetical protein [Croceivirga thetidis]|uniref:Phospholipase/carboxylesterase/thioesterase domain-containing protein n=1 Tax=Croceivirga thetidis TaxID=2721623 RepID=A0ABX1GMU4_9FLAO|nr:hypothetical protein [Croceivirga thetidis]NKI31238.1 hypothetical protein [Croceivirga thetidis]